MKKQYLLLVWTLIGIVSFTACTDDELNFPNPIGVTIESATGSLSVVQGETITLTAALDNPSEIISYSWTLDGTVVSTDNTYAFTGNELGDHEIVLNVASADNQGLTAATIEVYGKYKYGTFVLNEGTTGGFLNFISRGGTATDSVFYKENDMPLSLYAEDLYINDDRLYIVTQNGDTWGEPGNLYVANAQTLKAENVYQLTNLSTPTHVAVTDQNHVYVRDATGVYLFRPTGQSTTFIEGTEGATKHPMAVVDDKVFVLSGNNVLVINAGETEVADVIAFSSQTTGVVKADYQNVWVSCESGSITRLNTETYAQESKSVAAAAIPALAIGDWGTPSTSNITAKGDTLYFNGTGTQIYRYIFSTSETTALVDLTDLFPNATQTYNSVAVHPVSGELYCNVSEDTWGGAPYHCCAINVSNESQPQVVEYDNSVAYPAGIFFTYSFQ